MKSFKVLRFITLWGLLQFFLISNAQTATRHNNSTKIDRLKSTKAPVFEKVLIDSSNKYTAQENKIFDIVFRLTEVKSLARYLEKKTNGQRHLQMLLAGSPTKENKYYWVKVGEDNGYMFVTHYNFYVYKNPTRIFYLDTHQGDKVLSLEEFRRKNGM